MADQAVPVVGHPGQTAVGLPQDFIEINGLHGGLEGDPFFARQPAVRHVRKFPQGEVFLLESLMLPQLFPQLCQNTAVLIQAGGQAAALFPPFLNTGRQRRLPLLQGFHLRGGIGGSGCFGC